MACAPASLLLLVSIESVTFSTGLPTPVGPHTLNTTKTRFFAASTSVRSAVEFDTSRPDDQSCISSTLFCIHHTPRCYACPRSSPPGARKHSSCMSSQHRHRHKFKTNILPAFRTARPGLDWSKSAVTVAATLSRLGDNLPWRDRPPVAHPRSCVVFDWFGDPHILIKAASATPRLCLSLLAPTGLSSSLGT